MFNPKEALIAIMFWLSRRSELEIAVISLLMAIGLLVFADKVFDLTHLLAYDNSQ